MFAYEIEIAARELARELPRESMFAMQLETEWPIYEEEEGETCRPGDSPRLDAFHPHDTEIGRLGLSDAREHRVGLAGHPDFWPEWFGIWS